MSQFNLLVSDNYKLLIDSIYNLWIDEDVQPSNIAVAKIWNGSEWALVYQLFHNQRKVTRLNYYNGTTWKQVNIV